MCTQDGRVAGPEWPDGRGWLASWCNLLRRITITIAMQIPVQPNIKLVNTPEYRENYANSVHIRVNVWDFFLVFGTLQQQVETEVEVHNFQGVYLSPQQAKALMTILQQNVTNYEKTFGEIKLDPRMAGTGVVN